MRWALFLVDARREFALAEDSGVQIDPAALVCTEQVFNFIAFDLDGGKILGINQGNEGTEHSVEGLSHLFVVVVGPGELLGLSPEIDLSPVLTEAFFQLIHQRQIGYKNSNNQFFRSIGLDLRHD